MRFDNPREGAPWSDSTGTALVRPDGASLALARPMMRRLVLVGDSITSQGYTNAAGMKYSNHGWWVHALQLLGWPLTLEYVSASSGRTAAQINTAFDTESGSDGIEWLWGLIGTNDMGVGAVPAALAEIDALVLKAKLRGAQVMLGTVPPRASGSMSAAIMSDTLEFNRGMRLRARRGDFLLFDAFSALTDPASTTGAARSGVLLDTVHPNAAGAALIGRVAAEMLAGRLFPLDDATASNFDTRSQDADSGVLVLNPKLNGTGGTTGTGATGTTPTSWNLNRQSGSTLAVAGSQVADNDPRGRTWQRLTFSASPAGTELIRLQQSVLLSTYLGASIIGQTLRARARFRSSGLPTTLQYIRLFIECIDVSPAVIASTASQADSSYTVGWFPTSESVMETPALVVPAATITLRVTVNVAFAAGAASGYLDVTDVIPEVL